MSTTQDFFMKKVYEITEDIGLERLCDFEFSNTGTFSFVNEKTLETILCFHFNFQGTSFTVEFFKNPDYVITVGAPSAGCIGSFHGKGVENMKKVFNFIEKQLID